MQPASHVVTWDEFRTAFRAHHIPEGLIERKLNEFLTLTQGTRTVLQYAQVFNHLCQYAGYHADTDACKRDHFRRGLNTKLKERLNLVGADNFNELVNMAITQEDCISAHRAEKKWKTPTGPSTAQPPRYRLSRTLLPKHPPEQSTRQMGSQATSAGSIQSATDTTTPATTVARPEAELSATKSRKQQLSLFQLPQPVLFY
jgi:hypothetical protein